MQAAATQIIHVRSALAQAILREVCDHHEASWRLAAQSSGWVTDKSREIRNMPRHVEQGVSRPPGNTVMDRKLSEPNCHKWDAMRSNHES